MTNLFEVRESITFLNKGEKLFGIFHKPYQKGTYPTIVIFHGFASHKIGRNGIYVKIAEDLTQKGFNVLRFDFRGCGDSEGFFSQMTIENLISDGIQSLLFLNQLPGVDENKIGILGSSLGGAIAVYVAKQMRIQALVLWAAVASGQLWYQDWLKKNPKLDQEVLSTYNGVQLNSDFRTQFSLMEADIESKKLSEVPLLHLQGEEDEVVSLVHRQAFQKNRVDSKAESRFILIPNTSHTLALSPHYSLIKSETIHWFEKHLNNHTASYGIQNEKYF